MIWVTGDTHGDFSRLPGFRDNRTGPALGPGDKLVICGDFGGVWNGKKAEQKALDDLAALPYEILFVDGNHENFDLLERFPKKQRYGGVVREIRPNVLYLVRGQIFEIEGQSIWAMGGARSHDIEDGILDPKDPNFEDDYAVLHGTGARFRVKGVSWWPRELPSQAEISLAGNILDRAGRKIDYIVTHCAPSSVVDMILPGIPDSHDRLTDFFQEVWERAEFKRWYCGHYHKNKAWSGGTIRCLYEQITPLI